jgi:two-component system sensor histidine kinase ChiS
MNTFKALFMVAATFLLSCNNDSEKQSENQSKAQIESIIPKKTEAIGYIVPNDSIAEPKVTPINESKLKKIALGKPKVVPTNLNVHSAGKPKVIVAGKPRVCVLGQDSFSLPKIVPATDSSFVAKQPKPIPALSLRMKDAAIYNIQYLDVDQGMNSSIIRSIIQDKRGNLWFGTNGSGVSKYDGKTLTHFTTKEGLSSDYVWSILEDKSGNLWFGTYNGGVTKYDGKLFTHYTEKSGLSINNLLTVIEDKKGNIWFGTNGAGVNKYDGKTFTHYTTKQGLNSGIVRSILEDKSGNLWFGTNGGGVSKFDGKSFTNYTKKEGLSDNSVRSIFEDKNGNLWFGTENNGVNKFNGKTFTQYTTKEGLSGNLVQSIMEDKTENIWFGTKDGACKFDGNTFTHYTEKEGLSENSILSSIKDKSGNLWFGTFGGGVSRYVENSFTHYTTMQGLSHNSIRSIIEDKKGNLWFGTNGGGVCKYDGKSFTHYTEKEGLSSNNVSTIVEDKNGNLWFGFNGGGVSKFNGKTFTHFTSSETILNKRVWSIIEDKKGNLWFGTDGGVSKYDGKNFTHYTTKEGLSSNLTMAILEDKRGNIWIGTDDAGVTKYDGKTFTNYTTNQGLCYNQIVSIFEDKSGNLWFGTIGAGVSKYNGKYFTNYGEKDGLSSNMIWSTIEDKSGNIWLATEKGLNCIVNNREGSITLQPNDIDKNTNPKIINFGKADGLKAENFFRQTVLLDSKNCMWWGSGKALTKLDMNTFKLNETEPKIQLESIALQENIVDYRSLELTMNDSAKKMANYKGISFKGVADFYNYPIELELPYNLNHLTFYFSAIDWHYAPHKLKFQYKLEGLDKNWNSLTANNYADYRNIPYGNYTFKVKAIGSANKWSTIIEYAFVIKPSWWTTWWAYGVYGSLAILIIILIVKLNNNTLNERAQALKIKINEATSEIKEQKKVIEERHKEITDSINYAERIHRSLLASKIILDENLKHYFVVFKPKDIVSGDFYWATKLSNNNFVLMIADSTGHGVPGAIMSILNISCLEKSVEVEKLTSPNDILNHTRTKIIETLKNDGSPEGGRDGMDGSLLSFDFKNNVLQCSSAYSPIWIIRSEELIEIKADRFPIGKHEKDDTPFTLHTFNLQKNDMVYTLTDGYSDQFGGPKEKKFKNKHLKELLLSIAHEPMELQLQKLNNAFDSWKGNLKQLDDVTLVGIRI